MLVKKNVLTWYHQVHTAIKTKTDWHSGYEVTDFAAECIRALILREIKINGAKSTSILFESLIQLRYDVEQDLMTKYSMDEDGLRDLAPDSVKFRLGLLDAVIGALMTSQANPNFVEYDNRFHA